MFADAEQKTKLVKKCSINIILKYFSEWVKSTILYISRGPNFFKKKMLHKIANNSKAAYDITQEILLEVYQHP